MADAANIDPNTGRPIIQIGQKAVKKTMEVSPDGRPVIQLRPQAAAAAGTKASKRLGATAVKALRATNAGRLFR
jgi:hypothetical protein